MHLRLRFKAKLYKILTNANPHIQVKFSQKNYRKNHAPKLKIKNVMIVKISVNDLKETLHFVSQQYLSIFKKEESLWHNINIM